MKMPSVVPALSGKPAARCGGKGVHKPSKGIWGTSRCFWELRTEEMFLYGWLKSGVRE